jgi:hypothetical protein
MKHPTSFITLLMIVIAVVVSAEMAMDYAVMTMHSAPACDPASITAMALQPRWIGEAFGGQPPPDGACDTMGSSTTSMKYRFMSGTPDAIAFQIFPGKALAKMELYLGSACDSMKTINDGIYYRPLRPKSEFSCPNGYGYNEVFLNSNGDIELYSYNCSTPPHVFPKEKLGLCVDENDGQVMGLSKRQFEMDIQPTTMPEYPEPTDVPNPNFVKRFHVLSPSDNSSGDGGAGGDGGANGGTQDGDVNNDDNNRRSGGESGLPMTAVIGGSVAAVAAIVAGFAVFRARQRPTVELLPMTSRDALVT